MMASLRERVISALVAHGGVCGAKSDAESSLGLDPPPFRITVSPMSKAFGLGRLLFMLAKPHLVIGIAVYYVWKWRKGGTHSLRSLPLFALWIFCIYRTLQEQIRLRSLRLRAGVFAYGEKAKKLCNISDIRRLVLGYTPPFGLWNGDLLTVIPSLAQPKNLPEYVRIVFPAAGQEEDRFATDWTFPKAPWNRRVAVLIAGVGGNSKARYIVEIAEQFLAEGYIICVLNPRGLDDSPPVKDFSQLLDSEAIAADLNKLLWTVDEALMVPLQATTVLVGFSQGGIVIGKYFVTAGEDTPKSVLGGIGFSGTFQADFLTWNRYKKYYQPVIVPNLVESITAKYSEQFSSLLTSQQIQTLSNASSYAHMFETLALPYRDDFNSFDELVQALGTKSEQKHRVSKPLLLVSALDDPMHNPNMVGFEVDHEQENIIYAFTSQGGHVSWATNHTGSFGWMQNVASSFAGALHRA